MAASPTIHGGMPTTTTTTTTTPFLTSSCTQCLVALFALAFLTAFFMVLCLSLSFKLARRSRRSRRSHWNAAIPSAPTAMELWASPPVSHSQTTLLLTEALSPTQTPDPDPLLSLDWEWEEVTARQPRVTLQDIDQFWWRSHATAV